VKFSEGKHSDVTWRDGNRQRCHAQLTSSASARPSSNHFHAVQSTSMPVINSSASTSRIVASWLWLAANVDYLCIQFNRLTVLWVWHGV